MKSKKIIKIICITLACVILAFVLLAGGYVSYVALQYYRIEDNIELTVINNKDQAVNLNQKYSVLSYNLGFGAYSPEYTFFMDTGVMNDGTEVCGKYAKGIDKDDVLKNVNGQINVSKSLNPDFCLFQEADKKADRSYKIDMCESFKNAFSEHCVTYAQNFHTANLFYPFNDPIGKTDAGLLTFSRYKIQSALRRSFPVTTNFIDKLFDLDRCFAVHYLPVSGSDKKLALINLHMSAYDKGGTIRAQQLKMLNEVLKQERETGNFVIAGGDFNHCLIADRFSNDEQALQYFKSQQKTPDWVKNSVLRQSELAQGYKLCARLNAPTCRGADIVYEKDVTYTTVIDGFIVSDNVTVIDERTVDTQFAYSDHNPVILEFKLG